MSSLIGDYYREKAIDLEEAKLLLLAATSENNVEEMVRLINRVEYLTFLVSKTAASKIRNTPVQAVEPIQVDMTIEVAAPTVLAAPTVTTKPKSSNSSFFSKFLA